jgi:penicillin-binding protein 2
VILLPSTPPPREERPQSPQLALRVALFGAVAVLLFSLLFFRLWVLQVLAADKYRTAAVANEMRTVQVLAQRGRILDDNGRVLVDNRAGDAITFDLATDPAVAQGCAKSAPAPPPPKPISQAQMRRLLHGLHGHRRARKRKQILAANGPKPAPRAWAGCAASNAAIVSLARVAHIPLATFEDRIHESLVQQPFQPATLIPDAPRLLIFYIEEHAAQFRGIQVAKRSVRYYPMGSVAAQLFGAIGPLTADDLTHPATYPRARAGDVVGHSGVELTYDRWLRGQDGTLQVVVDASGSPQGQATLSPAPTPGDDLRLTIDAGLQRDAESALQVGMKAARQGVAPLKHPYRHATAGAMVVMDPKTGAVRALASYPTFDPNRLVGNGASTYISRLFRQTSEAPLLDRAAQGIYPPGSTFKPVTAIAALQSGLVGVDEPVMCDARLVVNGQVYKNFEGETQSRITMPEAITRSCDTYFYRLGVRLYDATSADGRRQPQPEWMKKLGFGRSTGLDIPDASGVAPDAAYKKKLFGKDPINNRWTTGDAINAAIGQGFVQVTPLQLADLYALIANGGTLVTPHLGLDVRSPGGQVVKSLVFGNRGRPRIDPYVLQSIKAGLRGVTHDVNGTAAQTFAGFPVGVAGKTGTAQKGGQDDYSWFVGYAPIDNPKYVVACVIERGGLGAVAAGRAVRLMFQRAFGVQRHGSGWTAGHLPDGTPIPVDATQVANGVQLGDPFLGK